MNKNGLEKKTIIKYSGEVSCTVPLGTMNVCRT